MLPLSLQQVFRFAENDGCGWGFVDVNYLRPELSGFDEFDIVPDGNLTQRIHECGVCDEEEGRGVEDAAGGSDDARGDEDER